MGPEKTLGATPAKVWEKERPGQNVVTGGDVRALGGSQSAARDHVKRASRFG